ncbi:hypothetical protein PAESOLCIP111_04489 [Paenibacillus solanacearum]|uniref:Fe/B12 periplasmic-binding domain-containing protein n=1 Tax=Paenibacillus solanacearum TaxID=2048548 RepID=A0A916K4D5_9BACL|nr:ABC transporter substrate-binding protein [Paenibacillus solanacearum]CAG7643516.1 hypothetical protein PAESOLCIP111_04489 [Paenibacillus solanacearum]
MFKISYRWLYLFSIAVLCIAMITGCGSSAQNPGAKKESSPSASEPAGAKSGAKRIVVTYFPYADHLFALGQAELVKGVVGLSSLQEFTVYDPFLKNGKIADLGTEANLEKIVALQPDLIIASQNESKIVDELSKIAKTVTVNATLNWQDTIKGVGAAIGEDAKVQAYIDQFVKKQNEVASKMDRSGLKGKTALFMMPWKKDFTYWSGSRMALYYEKLGFKPFDGLKNVGEITLEGISSLNPEYIFIGKDYSKASAISLDELAASPVWQSLDAVKNKRMFVVDTEILGPLAMGQYKGLEYMDQLVGTLGH